MSDPSAIVLDTVVLSGFSRAGWFENLTFWRPEYDLLVPQQVWETEFRPHHEFDSAPEWLELIDVETHLESEAPGSLSAGDWCCIAVAEQRSAILVTRDQALKRTADRRDIDARWSGRFLIDTFTECGIDEDEFEAGVDAYLADAHLSDVVATEIRATEKP